MKNSKLTNLKRQRTRLLNTKVETVEQGEYIQEELNRIEFEIELTKEEN